MEMSNLRADSHVAQQRRRDKLRIQQHSDPSQHLEDYTSNLEQLSVHQGLNPDLIQLRNVKYGTISYDPTVFQTTEMLNYVTKNSQVLLSHNDALVVNHQESAANQPNRPGNNVPFANLSHLNSSNLNASAKVSGDPQNCNTWKNIGSQESQQNCDWIVNYSGNSAGIESNQNPMFVGEGLSGPLKVNNIAASSLYMKPSSYGYQDVHSSLANPSSEISGHQSSEKHYGEMHFNSSPFYQDTLQEVVTSATMGTQGLEMSQSNIRETGRGSWVSGGNDSNELLLLPTYGDQSNPVNLNNGSTWMNRPVGGCHQWNGELGFFGHKGVRDRAIAAYDNSNTQGLSLSLSSVPAAKTREGRCGERDDSEDLRSRTGVFNDLQNSKAAKSDFMCSNSKPSISGRVFGNARQNLMGASSFTHPSTGPLGPFTGYATILKSSKYMKPTQQLLVEFCGVTCPKPIQTLEECSERISKEVSLCADAVNAAESMVGAKGGDSGASSSTFYGSNEISGEVGGRSSNTECYRPEYQQKKAKLLYMQEEVCKRYKQYHQQMQMVVSSFESVAGLSAATPYISVALRSVSRHFRCLKNAISDQLGHIKKALGEDLVVSNTTGTSSSKGDTSSTSRLKFIEHSFQRHKTGGSNLGFFEPQPPVWRPQRGLPERAVSVLRAWLFDHFLHPYPTDTDKHMLATQTGLTRNQVSNWFINARVRVWKPMVEEIHTLETKGMAEPNSNAGKPYGKMPSEGDNRPNDDLPTNSICMSPNTHVECAGSASTRDGPSAELWNQEKRSRVECQIRGDMDGSLMGFVPYQRNGLEIGGLGAVSLTLGLRQSVESAQQQQQLQQHEHQLRQHFGGQMIHDFVG